MRRPRHRCVCRIPIYALVRLPLIISSPFVIVGSFNRLALKLQRPRTLDTSQECSLIVAHSLHGSSRSAFVSVGCGDVSALSRKPRTAVFCLCELVGETPAVAAVVAIAARRSWTAQAMLHVACCMLYDSQGLHEPFGLQSARAQGPAWPQSTATRSSVRRAFSLVLTLLWTSTFLSVPWLLMYLAVPYFTHQVGPLRLERIASHQSCGPLTATNCRQVQRRHTCERNRLMGHRLRVFK